LAFITNAKAKDVSFMVKAKDLCFSDVKAKANDRVSSRTFQGLLLTQCFIIHYTVLCSPKIYK